MNSTPQSGLTPDHIVLHVRQIRPSWDHAGIRKAVREALNTYPLGIVRQAAIAAAGDPKVRTPGVIDARCQLLVESEKRRQTDAGAAAVTRPPSWPADLPAHHCGNRNCMCDHTRCFTGWAGESPCPECRPALTAAWIAGTERRAEPQAARPDPAPSRRAVLDQVRANLAARRVGSA